ncbi:hypothetical protein E4U54_005459 [Claviceps lovelessii]|nr:hypothetical protein E4U54_005459 [Claviceps lovelessii]
MRFSAAAAAAAVMAGSAVAHAPAPVSTDYTTELITITKCAETVTDCPARSTTTTSIVRPLTTEIVWSTRVHTITECHSTVTDCPARHSTEIFSVSTVTPVATPTAPAGTPSAPAGTPTAPAGTPSAPAGTPTAPGVSPAPVPSAQPSCPGYAVTAITRSYTTVLTTVEYQTIDAPCTGNPQGTGYPPNPTYPIGGNTTTPSVPVPTAGAATLGGSAILAAVAGLAALVLA